MRKRMVLIVVFIFLLALPFLIIPQAKAEAAVWNPQPKIFLAVKVNHITTATTIPVPLPAVTTTPVPPPTVPIASSPPPVAPPPPSQIAPSPPPPSPPPPSPPSDEGVTPAQFAEWSKVNVCEEGGNWYVNGPLYSGGLGISRANWISFGGGQFAPQGSEATPYQQILIAERIQPNPPDQNGCQPGGW
jgi:hypothetical protein